MTGSRGRSFVVLGAACFVVGLGARDAAAQDCAPPAEPTFTVNFPKLGLPPDEEGQGWARPAVWDGYPGATSDSITVPNGRPIYALIVSGYRSNAYLDELMVYDFARYLMSQGAYVHYAWWNNLLAPYMERPLHYAQSHPGSAEDITTFATLDQAADKAVPGEDYQFVADAKLFLSAIRAHNPSAIIIVVGHSMGGGAVIHLASQTQEVIDLVAPIDPVGNRNYPWAGLPQMNSKHFNWTRWRATRENFRGYKKVIYQLLDSGPPPVFGCGPTGSWLKNYIEASVEAVCIPDGVYVDDASAVTLGPNIINLHHRWQKEYIFPFDYDQSYNLGHTPPPGGVSSQISVDMQSSGPDPGGWPNISLGDCCPIGSGVAWPQDGHGEIVGYRGPAAAVKALGVKVRTSPQCAGCSGQTWPARTVSNGVWSNGDGAGRVTKLQALESYAYGAAWSDAPYNPALCKVSPGLISRFQTMNKPPVANAGPGVVVECNGCDSAMVTLDGSASSDPDGDTLTYTWTWSLGAASGAVVDRSFPLGVHCVALEVKDPSGHIARQTTTVSVVHSASPARLYTSNLVAWKYAAASYQVRTFDQTFPGIAGGIGCLTSQSGPVTLNLAGGDLTVRSTVGTKELCPISDASTAPMVSDALHNGADSLLEFSFAPGVSSFYTYFGSLAVGQTATMRLYSLGGSLLDTFTTPPSTNGSLAAGMGFTSSAPVAKVAFTTTEPGAMLVGAFVGLKPGEPSIGTIDLGPSYAGPGGTGVIQVDFACAFAAPTCVPDLTGDGAVGAADLASLLGAWGPVPPGSPADLTGDGVVNSSDLASLLGGWGPCP